MSVLETGEGDLIVIRRPSPGEACMQMTFYHVSIVLGSLDGMIFGNMLHPANLSQHINRQLSTKKYRWTPRWWSCQRTRRRKTACWTKSDCIDEERWVLTYHKKRSGQKMREIARLLRQPRETDKITTLNCLISLSQENLIQLFRQ